MDENSVEVIVIVTVHMPYQRRQYQQRSTNRVSSINVSSRKLNIFSRINAFSIVIYMMMLMMVMMIMMIVYEMILIMNDDYYWNDNHHNNKTSTFVIVVNVNEDKDDDIDAHDDDDDKLDSAQLVCKSITFKVWRRFHFMTTRQLNDLINILLNFLWVSYVYYNDDGDDDGDE